MLAVEERGKFADPLTIAAQSRDDTFEERLLMRLKEDRDKKGGEDDERGRGGCGENIRWPVRQSRITTEKDFAEKRPVTTCVKKLLMNPRFCL